MSRCFSTTDIARELNAEEWRIRRIFEAGDLEEPTRISGRRVIDESMIPQIIAALVARGWWRGTIKPTQQLAAV